MLLSKRNKNQTKLFTMKKNLLLFVFILISNTIFSQSYLGTITKQVNFRNEPSKTGELLKSLKTGSNIFIISIETENDFYNIIDIDSNLEGYVHKSFVKLGNVVSKSKNSVFTPNGKTTKYDSEVTIVNDTNRTLTLKLNEQYYNFKPYETKNLNLTPGFYDFRASAPGVVPYIGTESLKSNEGYSWKFYITTRRS